MTCLQDGEMLSKGSSAPANNEKMEYETYNRKASPTQASLGGMVAKVMRWLNDHWRWVVTLASSSIFIVLYGILYSYGLVMVELISEFGSSTTTTGYVGTIAYGISCLGCLVIVPLASRVGYRISAVIGVVLCASSCVISSFAPGIGMMFASYSFLFGIGVCLAMVASINSVTNYFPSRHQSLAMGICSCGVNLGVLFNPLVYKLNVNFGWRTMMRIMSAVVCVIGLPCALTFRRAPDVKETLGKGEDMKRRPESVDAPLGTRKHGRKHKNEQRKSFDGVKVHHVESECQEDGGTTSQQRKSGGDKRNRDFHGTYYETSRFLKHKDDYVLSEKISVPSHGQNIEDKNLSPSILTNNANGSFSAQDAAGLMEISGTSSSKYSECHDAHHELTSYVDKGCADGDGANDAKKERQWEKFKILFAMPDVWFLEAGLVLGSVALSFLYFSTVSVIITTGFSKKMASFAMVVMGISEVVGKVALGLILDRLPIPKIVMLMATNCLGAVLAVIISFITTKVYIFIQVAVQGLVVMASLDSLPHSMCNQMFSSEFRVHIWAANMLSMGTGGIFAAIFGESVDRTGTYQNAFYGNIGIFIASTLFFGFAVLYQKLFAKERYFVFKNVGKRYRAIGSEDCQSSDQKCKLEKESSDEAERNLWKESTPYLIVDRVTTV